MTKRIIIAISLFLSINLCFAKAARYSDDDLTLSVNYTENVVPGDAVFIRLSIQQSKLHKKNKTDFEKKALFQLYQDKKKIDQAAFYSISKSKKGTTTELLAGIPLSTWLKDDVYSAKVIVSFSENDTKEFSLPLTFKDRSFFKETIELDAQNTAIKTDNSPKRATQIDKLNNILNTVMSSDVYSLQKMQCPTTSTRNTAFFGDRRVYAYSNGKSSTSMHYGNDYGVPTGSSVTSCGTGRVVMAEERISTGFSIVIEHLPGLYSLYYHNSELNVKEGDIVKQGELIAKSGATGLATGPHLHWEMRLNGSAVVPEFFLQNFTFEEN